MKTLITTLLLLTVPGIHAQVFSMQPKGKVSELTVEIRNLYTDLNIEGGTGDAIRIQADNYQGVPEKAAGLRPLSAIGPDNTGLGMYINQSGNTVLISGTHHSHHRTDYHITVPANIKLRINFGTLRTNDILVRGMHNEVDIKSQVGDVKLEDVTGPIIANTLSADINVVFSALNQSSPSSISSVSGDIDITLPDNSKGDFRVNTVSGEVYTDFNFNTVNKPPRHQYWPGTSATARVNGGGVEFAVKSVSGDIFIRKKKNETRPR